MKRIVWLTSLILIAGYLAGCASSPANTTRAKAPASQETARGESRTRAKAHTDLGFEYYAQKQLGVALQEAKIALKDDNTYTPAYNLLALVYMGLGEQKSAEESFQRALQLSPGDSEISNNYGWFLCQTKRAQQSFQYFDMALQNPLYPTPGIALANSAECAMNIGDLKLAEGYLARALNLNPNSVRALLAMANLKYQQKQYTEARYYVSEVHKNIEPNAASTLLAYRIARQTGNRDDEARYLSLLRKRFSDSNEYKRLTQGAIE